MATFSQHLLKIVLQNRQVFCICRNMCFGSNKTLQVRIYGYRMKWKRYAKHLWTWNERLKNILHKLGSLSHGMRSTSWTMRVYQLALSIYTYKCKLSFELKCTPSCLIESLHSSFIERKPFFKLDLGPFRARLGFFRQGKSFDCKRLQF